MQPPAAVTKARLRPEQLLLTRLHLKITTIAAFSLQ